MKLIGFFLFFLLFVIALVTLDTPEESLRSGESLENKYFSSSSILFQYTGLPVIYAEVTGRQRRQRPYRNPLRRLRKQLRSEKRKSRRALKADGSEISQPSPQGDSNVSEDNVKAEMEGVKELPLRNKLGRKPSITTNHVFCPTEGCRGYRVLGPHPDHWIVGGGTYDIKNGNQRQMYRCKWCGQRFSETHGTVFYGLKTPQEASFKNQLTV